MRLCELTATQLAEGIREGRFKSIDVVRDFIEQIQKLNNSINAIVIPLFEDAGREAIRLDALIAKGEVIGPLHGVPITVKESLHVTGTPSTWGIEGHEANVSDIDDEFIQRLRASGAILLGKTNVMQLLLGCETVNPVYGRTMNPWDTKRTPGGSSGGEAAAVAALFSPLGMGTDIGGSIRTPSHFCGVHGLKPTSGLIPQHPPQGIYIVRSEASKMSSPGPIARSVEDLRVAFDVMAQRKTSLISVSGLRIGIWLSDGVLSPSPAIKRAIQEATNILEHLGTEIVMYQPLNVIQSMRTFYGLMCADGGSGIRKSLGGTRMTRQVQNVLRSQSPSKNKRRIISTVLRLLGQRTVTQMILPYCGEKSQNQYQQLLDRQSSDRQKIIDDMKHRGIDAIISPTFPIPAFPHDISVSLAYEGAYNSMMNYWGMPAGAFSCTVVRSGEEFARSPSKDRVIMSALSAEKESVGLPVAIQIAAQPGREDLVLSIMKALEQEFQSNEDYPPMLAKHIFQ